MTDAGLLNITATELNSTGFSNHTISPGSSRKIIHLDILI